MSKFIIEHDINGGEYSNDIALEGDIIDLSNVKSNIVKIDNVIIKVPETIERVYRTTRIEESYYFFNEDEDESLYYIGDNTVE